jgi:hypothetical protein
MDPPSPAVRWVGGVVAFATVLPGIVETVALVENLGWMRSVRVAPLRWTAGKDAACIGLGAACFALPLLWPDVFFPLTWGSFVFLLEPWNRAHARRSFLRDLEAGEAGPFCRTLLAGLACGLLWETWNFWARTKWIYTVPGFESWKLLEMPLAGFGGFPALALSGFAYYSFVSRLRGNGRRLAAGAALLFAVWASVAALDRNVQSVRPVLSDLPSLDASAVRQLRAAGIPTPERLDRAVRRDGLAAVAARTGVAADVRAWARLIEVQGGQRRRDVAEGRRREVERRERDAATLQRGEQRLLPFGVLVEHDQVKSGGGHLRVSARF